MKKTVSLKENHLFRRLYNKGRSAVCPELALYVRKNGRSGNRLGLTVSTKVGCAVVRNRVRRRLREIYRLNEDMLTSGVDCGGSPGTGRPCPLPPVGAGFPEAVR